jgi:hypothetical protein
MSAFAGVVAPRAEDAQPRAGSKAAMRDGAISSFSKFLNLMVLFV